MSSDDSGDYSANERLNEIIAEYLAAAEAGEAPDRREFLDRHADLADELKSFFADHDKMKELATLIGGVLSCSRPVVDKNWLPKYHQVGTSGKSVKPKVYFALGISGSFQHMAGLSGAGTIIAVNKDRRAPIFRAADYGVVEDLFKISDALKEKLSG